MPDGYSPESYAIAKASGERLPSGAKPLEKLSGKHLKMIALHMNGMKGAEIATVMGMTQSRVSLVLNDPLSQAMIAQRFVEIERELDAKSVKVVDQALDNADTALALRAADMVWKARGRYGKGEAGGPVTAEDIVAKMLEKAAQRAGGGTVELSLRATVRAPEPAVLDPNLIEGSIE